jgi:CBS-domain-containing membrane protein
MIALSCAEVMRVNLRTITATDSVGLARSEIVHDRISHIGVVDDLGRLDGIVCCRDLLGVAPETLVRDVMHRDIHLVGPGALAAHAVERMLHCHHDAIVVVDSNRHPIGIITSGEFLELAYRALLELDPERRPRRPAIAVG